MTNEEVTGTAAGTEAGRRTKRMMSQQMRRKREAIKNDTATNLLKLHEQIETITAELAALQRERDGLAAALTQIVAEGRHKYATGASSLSAMIQRGEEALSGSSAALDKRVADVKQETWTAACTTFISMIQGGPVTLDMSHQELRLLVDTLKAGKAIAKREGAADELECLADRSQHWPQMGVLTITDLINRAAALRSSIGSGEAQEGK